jgi:hypothetical protein
MIYDEQSCYDNKGTVHDIQVPNNIWLLAKPPAKKTPRVLSECLCCGPCRRRCRCFCSKKEQVAPEGGRCWGGSKQKVEGDLGETKFQPTQIGSQPRKMENRSTVTEMIFYHNFSITDGDAECQKIGNRRSIPTSQGHIDEDRSPSN